MRGNHPQLQQLLQKLAKRTEGMDTEKAYKTVLKSLQDWRTTEGVSSNRKPGRPRIEIKKARVFTTIRKMYEEDGTFPTKDKINARLGLLPNSNIIVQRFGMLKDIADEIGIPYPRGRTNRKLRNDLLKENDPETVLLTDLYYTALQHPEIHSVSKLIGEGYTKYGDTTYNKYVGNCVQIAQKLYIKFGLFLPAARRPGRKAA